MRNEKKTQIKQKCVGCQYDVEVINGLCSQCSMWLMVRRYTIAVKKLLSGIGDCKEVKKP